MALWFARTVAVDPSQSDEKCTNQTAWLISLH